MATLTVSDQLKAAIRAFGSGTAYAAAKASGVPVAGIQRFLNGERELRTDSVDRLCKALGLELRTIDTDAKPVESTRPGKAIKGGKSTANRK